MKKLIIILATAAMLGACKNQADEATEQKSREEQEMVVEAAKQATIDSMNTINAIRQQTIDSMKQQQELSTKPVFVPRNVYHAQPPHSGHTQPQAVSTPQPVVSTSQPETKPATNDAGTPAKTTEPEKKGLNNSVKGALIGAGAGAVTGAMVDKKRGEGAIVGALIGAGAGAIGGLILDKNKKKKEAEKAKQDSIRKTQQDSLNK